MGVCVSEWFNELKGNGWLSKLLGRHKWVNKLVWVFELVFKFKGVSEWMSQWVNMREWLNKCICRCLNQWLNISE